MKDNEWAPDVILTSLFFITLQYPSRHSDFFILHHPSVPFPSSSYLTPPSFNTGAAPE